MKSARTIRILILATMISPATAVRGDTFFDFGLRWTQWLPNRGKVQKFEREDAPNAIAVPSPSNVYDSSSLLRDGGTSANRPTQDTGSNPPPASSIAPAPTIINTYGSGYSAPSSYIPVSSVPAPTISIPPAPISVPSVPASAPNVYPVSMPPAANSGNTYPVSMPPAANYASAPPIVSKDRFDALIRMDAGPYPFADKLVTGQPAAWYASPVVQNIYGGTPTDEQKRTFENDVLQKVRETYSASGVNLNLTNDPSAAAARTISVVSGASYGGDANVAGITVMNGDGFSFIDKLDKAANVDDLEWAVARNVAHEMLHAFNVGHHDTSGHYLDAAVANWDMLIDKNTKFSDSAIADLRTQIAGGIADSPVQGIGNFAQHIEASTTCAHCIAAQRLGAQSIDAQPVPEPATIALWLAGAGLLVRHHRNRRKQAA
ncbi:PEP-CTERM sorting domain-containing protein [bacterium]|nr:PEP-CTERM sorting domain-containing protein [bacterium]